MTHFYTLILLIKSYQVITPLSFPPFEAQSPQIFLLPLGFQTESSKSNVL